MKLALISLLFVWSCCAQATRIGQHHLGETIEEWLAVGNFTAPEQACQTRRKDVKGACEANSARVIAAMTSAVSETMTRILSESCVRDTNEAGQSCDAEMSKIGSGGNGVIVSVRDNKREEWEFAGRKLAKFAITIPNKTNSSEEPDTAQEIKFLTEAYGPPGVMKTLSFQNSYGAKWECPEAIWAMPDGAGIVLRENIRNTDSGPRREVRILFISQDLLKLQKNDAKPNPYK